MKWLNAVLAVGLAASVMVRPAEAQEEREECECPSPHSWIRVWPRGEGMRMLSLDRQARLGVIVQTRANPETDRYGALIEGVAEGGPAERAGLQQGDIVTKLAGESLLSGDESFAEDVSAPGMRLIERARELERGDTVEIEYRRDGDVRATELVAGEFEGVVWGEGFGEALERSARLGEMLGRLRELPEIHIEAPESFAVRLARLPNLELVSLNPELGEYFGTDEGVLVVSVPEESELGIEAGDVIQSIDGREVRSPSHAMRILRSYEADEEVAFEVIRKQRRMTVQGRVTEHMTRSGNLRMWRY